MKKQNGFTMIEIMLVLAIAGLIFAMVFLALPALQASQRDTARRESVISFIDNLKKFQSNNSRGALPGTNKDLDTLATSGGYLEIFDEDVNDPKLDALSWRGFYRDYLGENFVDPAGAFRHRRSDALPGVRGGHGARREHHLL